MSSYLEKRKTELESIKQRYISLIEDQQKYFDELTKSVKTADEFEDANLFTHFYDEKRKLQKLKQEYATLDQKLTDDAKKYEEDTKNLYYSSIAKIDPNLALSIKGLHGQLAAMKMDEYNPDLPDYDADQQPKKEGFIHSRATVRPKKNNRDIDFGLDFL